VSTASTQRVGLAFVLLGGFASIGSSGTFGSVAIATALVGFVIVLVGWLHDF